MNKTEISLFPIFSSLLASQKININTNKLLKIAQKEKYRIAGRADSLSNHVSRTKNLNVLDKKILKNEKNILENYINHYSINVLKYNNKLKLTTSWFVEAKHNQTSDPHDHVNSLLSAVLYLKPTPECGAIMFKNLRNPSSIYITKSEYNIWNADAWTIVPEDNLLVIFPSYLYHKILPGKNKEPRYSLAMNFFPVGEIGEKGGSDSFINIKDVDGK